MDIKRTVLLVVFSLSLLMLWENWNRSNGNPSLFGEQPAQTAQPAANAAKADASLPQATAPQAAPATGADVPAGAPATAKGETIAVTTDLLKVEVNTAGGELTRVELLKHRDAKDDSKPVVLLESGAGRTYVGQSGLIGGNYPNHRTIFTARAGKRALESDDKLELVLDAELDGVKLTKTFVFQRGQYEIGLKHEVANGGAAAISPSVYV